MLRLAPLALALLLGLASAPSADAQIGRLLNRAREAVSGTAEDASAAAQQAQTAVTNRTPSPDDPSPATLNGRPAPVMDYLSMMTTGYEWTDGGYWYDGDHYLLFYPGADADAHWTVTDGDGRTLFTEESRFSRTGDATFNNIRAPRFMGLNNSGFRSGDGEFALNMIVDGQLVGHIPYTVQVVQGGDVYSPRTEYRIVDGPWERLAAFTYWLRQPEESLGFHGWVTGAELGDDTKVRVTLYHEGAPVAACHVRDCPRPAVDANAWASVKTTLVRYAARDASNLTVEDRFAIEDVRPGAYEVRVTGFDSGTLIRRYTLRGAAGAFEEHPRSAQSYEPRYDHLSPRTRKPNAGGSGNVQVNQTFWMEVAE